MFKCTLAIGFAVFVQLFSSSAAAKSDIKFESFYTHLAQGRHIGYIIKRLSFDIVKNEYTLHSYAFAEENKGIRVVLMETTVLNKEYLPISYTNKTKSDKVVEHEIKFNTDKITIKKTINKTTSEQSLATNGERILISTALNYYFSKKLNEKSIAITQFSTFDFKIKKNKVLIGKMPTPYNKIDLYYSKIAGEPGAPEIITYFNKLGDDVSVNVEAFKIKMTHAPTLKQAIGSLVYNEKEVKEFFGDIPKGNMNYLRVL